MSRLEGAVALNRYLTQVAAFPRLNPVQQAALAVEAAAGDPLALRTLAQSYLSLVVGEANRRRGEGVRFQRLLAAGNQALLHALRQDPGDPSRLLGLIQAALDKVVVLAGAKAKFPPV